MNETVVKKGKPTWKPAEKLAIRKKDRAYRYRWCDKDEANIDKKLAEGWEFVKAEHEHPEGVMDGRPLTSTTEYRELVTMRMPEEMAEARAAYFQERANAQERAITADVQKEARQIGAQLRGNVVIE